MRIILISLALISLFALLLRALPPAYHLPLYCIFLLVGIALAFRERRQIQTKQTALEEEYHAQQVDWQAITRAEGEEE